LVLFKYSDWLWTSASEFLTGAGLIANALPEIGSLVPADSPWRSVLLNADGHIRLPIGISFFTFQGLSYVLDVHRGEGRIQKNPIDFALYIALFPQLIAGPIVRYRDVYDQIVHRTTTVTGFAYGVRRFVIGLGKKMLIANFVAKVADAIFLIPSSELPPSVAWLGIVCYTLHIYFDFSAYSDMAIGLGHMFGFSFLENFNYPYVSRSITEFWRRWHMSLSSWFRDYLYIPLGGNRRGPYRTYFNLLLVFFLCGLWHGASFNFVVWGLFHGGFLVVERVGLGAWLEKQASVLRHAYVLLVVMVGWVFFRAADLTQALAYLRSMCWMQPGKPDWHHVGLYFDSVLVLALVAGIIGSMPWLPKVAAWHERKLQEGRSALGLGLELVGLVLLGLVFFSSALELSAGTYNPFIYFRF
jgi:alginate O-acetyltransferase complex protein AlgI